MRLSAANFIAAMTLALAGQPCAALNLLADAAPARVAIGW